MPDRGAVDEPAARESAPGLEDEVGFAPRQHLRVVGAQDMRLRDVGAQDPPFVRLDPEVAVAIRRRQPFHEPFVAAGRIGEGIGRNIDRARRIGLAQGGEVVGGPRETTAVRGDFLVADAVLKNQSAEAEFC